MTRHTARNLTVIFLIVGIFAALRISLHVSDAEIASAAARFRFSKTNLPEIAGPPVRMQRLVHPAFQRISAFVSTLGAAVALNDIDGDGAANDACYIDTRTDQLIITPVPGTGDRYTAFALNQGSLFDRDRMAPVGVLLSDVNEDGHVDVHPVAEPAGVVADLLARHVELLARRGVHEDEIRPLRQPRHSGLHCRI